MTPGAKTTRVTVWIEAIFEELKFPFVKFITSLVCFGLGNLVPSMSTILNAIFEYQTVFELVRTVRGCTPRVAMN